MYDKNYELLADAIIVQAAKDYRKAKSFSVRNEIKCFFLSDWFGCLTNKNSNNATGKTDSSGMLKVPNNQSSTGDDNGTVGKDDNDKKDTFVVKVTDKTNAIIPDCEVYIGESNNLVVILPDGIKPTSENPVIITVTDQNGNAKDNISVIALGESDYRKSRLGSC